MTKKQCQKAQDQFEELVAHWMLETERKHIKKATLWEFIIWTKEHKHL